MLSQRQMKRQHIIPLECNVMRWRRFEINVNMPNSSEIKDVVLTKRKDDTAFH